MSYDPKTATPNYHLPQWKADDKPSRQDYNEAFENVDSALANKVNKGDAYAKADVYNKAEINSKLFTAFGATSDSNNSVSPGVYMVTPSTKNAPSDQYGLMLVYTSTGRAWEKSPSGEATG